MRATENKVCLECGETIKGRSDKKFCSDACRNMYHYRSNNAPINYVRNVVNALKRNRRILTELNDGPEGTKKVHREKLVERGYNFMYHTNIYRTRKGNTYVFCFEHGYLELNDDWLALVRRDQYLEKAGDV
jgi:predicted nucleic acid-binding Zn ribbon protein